MKTLNRIISLLMVALMLTAAVPFTPVSAADDGTESYTLTVENTYTDSYLAESSNFGGMSFFGSTEFDGCYGNQLSGVAREIYDSLVKKYVTDKKTGEYTHTFETSFTFDAEISGGSIVMNDKLEEIDIEIGYAVQAAMDAFLYDNPEVFWLKKLSTSYGVSASGNSVDGFTGSIEDITIIPEEIYAGASSKISQYDIAVDSALESITVTESRYDTLKNIHDYICNNAWYNLVNEQRVHSSEPFFIGDGGVVCEGYAKAFKVLCDRMAIPCVLVSGDAGGAHMWNYVQMDDDKWYLVDATWDDQESKIYDTYFLANANTVGFNDVTISEERTERNDFSGTGIFSFTYPVLSATAYTVHVHEWESDYTVDVEPTCTEKGSKSIHCNTCEATKRVTEISATNHANKTDHAQQDATCTENGYTAGVYCNDCGIWLEGHDIITTERHIDENNDGICDVCEEYLSEVIETGKCGDNVNYIFYKDGTLIISGNGVMKNYNLASRSPFEYNDDINTIIIENGVKNIGDSAFKDCDGLESVVIENTVESIGQSAFYSCNNVKNIVIPDSVVIIGNEAFSWCYSLENISLSDSVVTLGNEVFYKCESLLSIAVPKNVKNIGEKCFDSKTAIYCMKNSSIGSYVKNNNYKYVYIDGNDDESIFEGKVEYLTWKVDKRTGLLELSGRGNMPDFSSNTPWSDYGYAITSVDIDYTLTSIGAYAFKDLYRLTKIALPYGITKINNNAFYLCVNLVEIEIPNSVTAILQHAFAYCKKLKSISIPYSVSVFGVEPFLRCDTLESIKFELNSKNTSNLGLMPNISDTNIKEVVLPASINKVMAGNFPSSIEKVIVCNPNFDFDINCGLNAETVIVGFKDSTAEFFADEINAKFIDIETVHTHEYKYVELVKSSCSINGEKIKRCICGKEQITTLEKLSHTFTTYTSDGNATCLVDGTKTAVCDVCNKAKDTVTDEGSKDNAEHKYSVRAGSSATCTEDGERIYVCDVCETATYTETVPATGKHSFVACLGEDPTCTEDGFIEYCCEICETETYRETVPATGHDYDSVITAPTCTSKGYTTHTCSVCDEGYTDDYVNAKGHKGGTATCKAKAECTVCGEEYGSINANNHKSLVVLKAVPSTCTKTGLIEGEKCTDCGKITLAQRTVAKKAHTNKTTVTKATLSKNGKSENKCTACGYVSKTTVIYAPKTVKLSATSYTYDGKTKTPSVTVKDSKGKKLKNGTDYTVKYSKGRKSIGKYTVTVTFKGNYSGTKKLTFEIVPTKVTLSKLTAGSKALTATWKTVSGATGYEVQYSTSKKFTKKTTKAVTIKKAKTKKTTIKKLKKGKKYYVKVRAYKTVSGKKIYSAWSSVKSIKIK